MTQERIAEILAIVDRAKEYDGISYALEQAVCELIYEVVRLTREQYLKHNPELLKEVEL